MATLLFAFLMALPLAQDEPSQDKPPPEKAPQEKPPEKPPEFPFGEKNWDLSALGKTFVVKKAEFKPDKNEVRFVVEFVRDLDPLEGGEAGKSELALWQTGEVRHTFYFFDADGVAVDKAPMKVVGEVFGKKGTRARLVATLPKGEALKETVRVKLE